MLNDSNRAVNTVLFRQMKSIDASIAHTASNRSAAGDRDDEAINVGSDAPGNVTLPVSR
ncbi:MULTISPECIES: hypothetical protein [unclassified Massilia]|uniref:hypothetical protein n=1 Tax=unclassified Massilia TaxID=2609279 RepID=UPI0017832856|nr:hypothetical protein [Massilia sp. CFBP 13647]MBD8672606.1 hypothetical protein [Massilia sp. CFBP 13721]